MTNILKTYSAMHSVMQRHLRDIDHIDGEAPIWGYDENDDEVCTNIGPAVLAYLARQAAAAGNPVEAIKRALAITDPHCQDREQRAWDELRAAVSNIEGDVKDQNNA